MSGRARPPRAQADRRQQLLSLSAAGRSHDERAHSQTVAMLRPLLSGLSADELGAVQVALPALRAALTQEEDPHGDGTAR